MGNKGGATQDTKAADDKPKVPPIPMEDLGEGLGQQTPPLEEGGGGKMEEINREMGQADLDALNEAQDGQRMDVGNLIQELREEMQAEMQSLRSFVAVSKVAAAMDENGIQAEMIGATFNCPLCGLRIIGPSLTGQKGVLYEHPFDDSPKLSGQKCELKGQKFKSPVVYLQFAKPRPLTGKTE